MLVGDENEQPPPDADGNVPPQGHGIKNIRVPLPPNITLKGNMKTNWQIFKQLWTSYELLTGLKNQAMEYRVAAFVTCIGQKALEIHTGLPFKTEEDKGNLDTILKLWEEYCCGQTNVIYERFCFNKCDQNTSETFDQYLVKLRKLASSCEYGNMASDMIRDRTVCGIRDDDIRKELLNESTLTLESCIKMVKSFEATAKQAKTMSHSGSTNSVNHDVSYISKRKQGTTKKFQGNRKPCKFCGQTHVWGRDNCPAYDKRCSSCGNKGHFEIKCGDFQNLSKSQKSQSSYRKKSRKPIKSSAKNIRALGSDTSDSQSDTSEFSEYEEQCSLIDVYEPDNENVHNVQPKGTKSGTIVAKMYLHKTREPVIMQVDSGASCNVLPAQYLPANVVLTKTSKKLRMYSNDMVPVLGTCKLRLKNPRNGKRYLVPFYVISNLKGSLHKLPLLGSTTAQQMQLISVNHENIAIVNELQDEMSNVKTKENLCQEYRDVFSGRGCMPGNVTLYVDETSDNGPPFNSSAFANFATEYQFTTVTSSPEYPQSNGKVESAVKIAKNLVRKTNKDHKDVNRALLAWRNTPTAGLDSSPAQRMFGRRTRTSLPIMSSHLKPNIPENVTENKQKKQRKQKESFDRGAKELPFLQSGDIVRMKPKPHCKEWKKARVKEMVNCRSYKVQTECGAEYIRNRRHLRLSAESFTLIDHTFSRKFKLRKQTQSETPPQKDMPHVKCTTKPKETQNNSALTRRSTRVKRKPGYLKDYV
ncbi:uncharacterized protein LOC117121877 [Anneissia japonica]|uniref:uncharacterized protein LOC117121877 n=1 Tax=Anneissia japonica TaxID=1529436 RepID=UPI001425581C|nr:uncharacterized protein LOC117121877 [Anneissia japonica]